MHHRNSFKKVALVVLLLVSITSAYNLPLPPDSATASITARDLKKHLSFLASDELGGRYTLSPSILTAARYLASQLESYGFRGAARDGSFFQKVPLSYRTVDKSSGIIFDSSAGKEEFKFGDDFVSESPEDIDLTGGLVFVGYGISSIANNYDDFAKVDVKGKIVVMVPGAPDALKGVNTDDEESRLVALRAHGAVGALVAPPPQILVVWDQIKNFVSQESPSLPPRATNSDKPFPAFIAGPRMLKAIARMLGKDEAYLTRPAGKPLDPGPVAATVQIKLKVDARSAPTTGNVVGVLEGSDPRLKDEYVVFSAHYDHLKTSSAGEVYNGADDDGSGTSAVLEIAEALSLARPKRSVLIIFHTGEELGLFGSAFNTDYEPAVPLAKLVADFNIDMIGRTREPGDTDSRDKELCDKDSVYVIGADKLSTELNRISEDTNKETARMRFDYTYNDENHPQRFYYRSDHYNYAKHGIPIIFYFTGVHRDYHRTTDDVDKIDFEKMERITRLVFATGWRVANLDHRLTVDKKPAVQPAR
ncbi:MAG TPA: M28 family peptidase [Blastocatellia bacterium]|jgi:hypothetical protein